MSWLIGSNAKSISLCSHYWTQRDPVDPAFIEFFKRRNLFLNFEERLKLKELTFLDTMRPFGKVDTKPNIGMVATDESIVHNFEADATKAINFLKKSPELSALIESHIKFFAPLTSASAKNKLREKGSGKSAHWLKGSIFLSLPKKEKFSEFELALNIVHELGHQVIMIFQDGDQLLENISEPIYSAVRRTERPAIMSFHALVATYFMFYSLAHLLPMNFEDHAYLINRMKSLRSDFIAGAYAFKDIQFTALGYELFSEMINFVKAAKVAA